MENADVVVFAGSSPSGVVVLAVAVVRIVVICRVFPGVVGIVVDFDIVDVVAVVAVVVGYTGVFVAFVVAVIGGYDGVVVAIVVSVLASVAVERGFIVVIVIIVVVILAWYNVRIPFISIILIHCKKTPVVCQPHSTELNVWRVHCSHLSGMAGVLSGYGLFCESNKAAK